MAQLTTAIEAALRSLPFVKRGQKLVDVATADRWNAITTVLIALARGDNIQRCANIRVRKFPYGFALAGSAVNFSPARLVPFELIPSGSNKVRVVASTLAGEVPTGMSALDDPVYELTVAGDGVVYGVISYTESTGEITSRTLGHDATVPDDTATTTHVLLGAYSVGEDGVTVNNVAYGPVNHSVCRLWGEATVKYSVALLPSTYV